MRHPWHMYCKWPGCVQLRSFSLLKHFLHSFTHFVVGARVKRGTLSYYWTGHFYVFVFVSMQLVYVLYLSVTESEDCSKWKLCSGDHLPRCDFLKSSRLHWLSWAASCCLLSTTPTTTGHVKDGQAANRRSRKQAASYIYFFFFLHWLSQTVLRWFAFPLPVLLWWVEPRRTPDGPASPPSGQRCRLVTFVTSNLTLPFVFEFLISASFLLFHHDRFQLFPVPCFFTAGENISWCLPQKLLYN